MNELKNLTSDLREAVSKRRADAIQGINNYNLKTIAREIVKAHPNLKTGSHNNSGEVALEGYVFSWDFNDTFAIARAEDGMLLVYVEGRKVIVYHRGNWVNQIRLIHERAMRVATEKALEKEVMDLEKTYRDLAPMGEEN